MSVGVPLPGFETPAVGFEQPFEMLEACHGRVQRSLDLLRRLVAYIDEKGHDAGTRSAAADVLRYFDIAAPLHHEDEELHVFPRLLAQADEPIRQAVQTLQHDHRRMVISWAAARQSLLPWAAADSHGAVDAQARADIARFLSLYAKHIDTEESLVYPAARAVMNSEELAAMGQEMQARRRG